MTELTNEEMFVNKNEQSQVKLKQKIIKVVSEQMISYDKKISKLDMRLTQIINENKIYRYFLKYIINHENISIDLIFDEFLEQYNEDDKKVFSQIYKGLFE